jgi:hypothetical protein
VLRGGAATLVSAAILGLLAQAGAAREATFPGRNGLLAYTLPTGVWAVNADGSGTRNATLGLPVRPADPAWASDGNRIAFANTLAENGGIWVVRADGTGARRVTDRATDREPTWAPDGMRVAFVRADGGRDRIFVVNASGGGLGLLTPFVDLNVQDPEWSPDGARLAFSDGSGVYVVDADGSDARRLADGRSPSWAPDGRSIAFARGDAILAVGVDGGGEQVVAGGVGAALDLSWAPDGTRIAFVGDQGRLERDELFVVGADGTGLTRLNVDSESAVDWGPALVLPPPVAGASVNIGIVSGIVRVRVRGTGRFVSLGASRQVPVGSEVDVTRGRLRLTSDAGAGQTQVAIFYDGRGVVRQERAARPVTELELSGPLACAPRRAAGGAPSPRVRRLWGDGAGRFRTRGRFASASVRGTVWLTEDRCDGTFVRVVQGDVAVRDLVRNRTVPLRDGQSYLARARR